MLNVDFLKAEHGDCIHISFWDEAGVHRNILIDGGPSSTYLQRSDKKKKKKTEDGPLKVLTDAVDQIDLLVVTHIDDDHIGGILKWFSKDQQVASKVKKVWFNSPKQIIKHVENNTVVNDDTFVCQSEGTKTSSGQGKTLEELLSDLDITHNGYVTNGYKEDFHGLEIHVLTPFSNTLSALLDLWVTEQPDLCTATNIDHKSSIKQLLNKDHFVEDKKVQNLSSISFVVTFEDRKFLFLADAGPTDVTKALSLLGYDKDNKINVEFIKISHHGSKKSTSRTLLESVETSKYIISTNGKYHGHPDKTCLARIIDCNNAAQIYFNYPEFVNTIFSEVDCVGYPQFSTHPTTEIEL
ncbi:ComEC/Rec2 family competence protein [Vibrio rarus]|uniref:ComEC/Rec2 family competence protein n=1 Tax=Vibrio rarus TaxID=413403 RepID=UPI0021C2875E|nr:MBL fold metallo-hydrolase [Vibrio rarus]